MSEIFCIRITDPEYPRLLTTSAAPPEQLYCRGNKMLLAQTPSCAIVGSRTPTSYGLSCADAITDACVERGVITISGLAFGIDARVHARTVEQNGATIAVLGSGIDDDTIYPRTNHQLARHILSHDGLLVSEYPPGTKAHKGSFPLRNRIIAGLAQATCVVEAKEKSGSLITAYCALDSNREVFAVPGSIFSPQSAGTLRLIEKGAAPWLGARSFDDLFPSHAATHSVDAFTPNEQVILAACAEAHTIDALLIRTALPLSTLQESLGRLLLSGYITLTPHGSYLTIRAIH